MIRNPELTNPDFAWDDFIPAVRDGATIEGQIPIIPDRAASLPILYYRRDLFQQFKLERPKTWQDVRNAAKTIYEGTNKQVFGIVLRGKGAAATSMFGPVLYDFGGRGPIARRRHRVQHAGGAGRVRMVGFDPSRLRAARLGEQPLGGSHQHLQPGSRGHAVRRHHFHHDSSPIRSNRRSRAKLATPWRPRVRGQPPGGASLPPPNVNRSRHLRRSASRRKPPGARAVPERQGDVQAIHAARVAWRRASRRGPIRRWSRRLIAEFLETGRTSTQIN